MNLNSYSRFDPIGQSMLWMLATRMENGTKCKVDVRANQLSRLIFKRKTYVTAVLITQVIISRLGEVFTNIKFGRGASHNSNRLPADVSACRLMSSSVSLALKFSRNLSPSNSREIALHASSEDRMKLRPTVAEFVTKWWAISAVSIW